MTTSAKALALNPRSFKKAAPPADQPPMGVCLRCGGAVPLGPAVQGVAGGGPRREGCL